MVFIFMTWSEVTRYKIQKSTVSPLHTNLQVENFQRCEHATTQTSVDRFFKRADRTESSKEPEPVPSTSGVSEIAAHPPSPIADDPSALPSPTSSPSSVPPLSPLLPVEEIRVVHRRPRMETREERFTLSHRECCFLSPTLPRIHLFISNV